jgi:hypothetical protein
MPCSHTRLDVSRIVLEVIRHIQNDPTITEASVFGPQGINVDSTFRSTYFFPIKMSVEKVDCLIKNFSTTDCENAGTVGDIVDAVFKDFQLQAASPAALAMAAVQPSRVAIPSRKASKARKSGKAHRASKAGKAKTKKR